MSTLAAFVDLFRAYPARTAVHSVAPVAIAGAQALNALVHGVSSPLVAGFVLVLLAFAAGATRQSLAAFHTESLEGALDERP
jgi:hypothetical protein